MGTRPTVASALSDTPCLGRTASPYSAQHATKIRRTAHPQMLEPERQDHALGRGERGAYSEGEPIPGLARVGAMVRELGAQA